MVQGPALTVPPHLGQGEDRTLARGQQALAGELRRGVQIHRPPLARRGQRLRREGVQMSLVARRDLQGGSLNLGEVPRLEPPTDGPRDPVAGHQERQAIRPAVRRPPRTFLRAGQGCDCRALSEGGCRFAAKARSFKGEEHASSKARNMRGAGDFGAHRYRGATRISSAESRDPGRRPAASLEVVCESHCQLAPQGLRRRP